MPFNINKEIGNMHSSIKKAHLLNTYLFVLINLKSRQYYTNTVKEEEHQNEYGRKTQLLPSNTSSLECLGS